MALVRAKAFRVPKAPPLNVKPEQLPEPKSGQQEKVRDSDRPPANQAGEKKADNVNEEKKKEKKEEKKGRKSRRRQRAEYAAADRRAQGC